MALVKGKYISPSSPIKSTVDPVSAQDLSRKGYVDTKAAAEALSAKLEAQSYADGVASTAQSAAESYVDQKISELVNGAPGALDTLKELADSLGSDGNFASTITNLITEVDNRVTQEVSDREAAIDTEQLARQAAINVLNSNLQAEQTAREDGDSTLQLALNQEISSRTSGDSSLQSQINTEKSRAEGEEARIEGKVDQEILDRQTAVSDEATARQAGDALVQSNLDAEVSRALGEEGRIELLLSQEVSDRQTAISDEQAARAAAVSAEETARQTAISAEQAAREAADSTLSDRLDVLETDPTTKAYVDSSIATEQSARQSDVSGLQDQINDLDAGNAAGLSAEIVARESGDANLQSQVDTEKARIDAILLASDADKDSFAEVVQLISGIDTANDSAFAGYVLSNDAALAQEVSDREAGDTAQQQYTDTKLGPIAPFSNMVSWTSQRINVERTQRVAEEQRIEGKVDQEVLDRIAAVSAEQSARESAITSEQSARESADSALDTRVTTLENEPRPRGHKESVTISSSDLTNGYVDLSHEAMEMTVNMSVSAVMKYEGEDYSVSVVGGVTRVVFMGDLLAGGASPLEVDEKIYFQYMTTQESSSGGGGDNGGGGDEGGDEGGGDSSGEQYPIELSVEDNPNAVPGWAYARVSLTRDDTSGITYYYAAYNVVNEVRDSLKISGGTTYAPNSAGVSNVPGEYEFVAYTYDANPANNTDLLAGNTYVKFISAPVRVTLTTI
jgi:hypothetical protein